MSDRRLHGGSTGRSVRHVSGVPSVRLAWISPDGYAHEVDPLMLDAEGIAKLCVVIAAARAYRLAGPKFSGSSSLLASVKVGRREIDEIRRYLDVAESLLEER